MKIRINSNNEAPYTNIPDISVEVLAESALSRTLNKPALTLETSYNGIISVKLDCKLSHPTSAKLNHRAYLAYHLKKGDFKYSTKDIIQNVKQYGAGR